MTVEEGTWDRGHSERHGEGAPWWARRSINPGKPRVAGDHQKLGEDEERGFLGASKEEPTLPPPGPRISGLQMVRQHISSVLSLLVCGALLQQPPPRKATR